MHRGGKGILQGGNLLTSSSYHNKMAMMAPTALNQQKFYIMVTKYYKKHRFCVDYL